MGSTVDQLLYAAEILTFIILDEIIAASVCQNCQMLVLGSNHSGGHLIYGAVTSACYKACLFGRILSAVFTHEFRGAFFSSGEIKFVVDRVLETLNAVTDNLGVARFAGLIVNDKAVMHSPDRSDCLKNVQI